MAAASHTNGAGPARTAARPVVIGAGPAGLAAAWALKRAGADPILLERAGEVCSSWRGHYLSARLNSPRRLSSLPGMRMPAEYGTWVGREDFIRYVEAYADAVQPEIRFDTPVTRIDRAGDGWVVRTPREDVHAPAVVVATGLNGRPQMPDWPGAESFAGELLHVRSYRSPEPYAGKHALVVGPGASGVDAALELARNGAASVRLSVRTPPLIFRRHISTALMSQLVKHGWVPGPVFDRLSLILHRVLWGDLSDLGLGRPTEGMATALARRGHGATMDRGLIAALRSGRVRIVPAVEGFDGEDVLLAGGERIQADVVIAATGQRPDLEEMVGHLGVLAEPGGRPAAHGARSPEGAPGLYFLGYRTPPGQLPDLAIDARAIARRVAGRERGNGLAIVERSRRLWQDGRVLRPSGAPAGGRR